MWDQTAYIITALRACDIRLTAKEHRERIIEVQKKSLKDEILRKFGTLQRFQEVSGIPRSSVHNWVTRGVETMTVGTLYKVCEALDCPPDDFVELYSPKGRYVEVCSEEEHELLDKFRNNEAVASAVRLIAR